MRVGDATVESGSLNIILGVGTAVNDAESRIREYCSVEVYRDVNFRGGYDDHRTVDDAVTAEDVEAANNFYAQITGQDRERITRNKKISELLAEVKDVDLGATTEEEWNGIKARIEPLLAEFLLIPNVSLAKATKILYLKRPHLFPVLDSFVLKFVTGTDVTKLRSKEEWLRTGLVALDAARHDMMRNRAAFDELQSRLSDLPTPLTTVRIFSILCWTQEKWVIRNDTFAPHGVASRSLDQHVFRPGPNLDGTSAPSAENDEKVKSLPGGEILSVKEFRRVIGRAEGVIVVTGTSPPLAHAPLCTALSDDRFNRDVVLGRKATKYYWRPSLLEARREFGAVPCKRCRGGEASRATPASRGFGAMR